MPTREERAKRFVDSFHRDGVVGYFLIPREAGQHMLCACNDCISPSDIWEGAPQSWGGLAGGPLGKCYKCGKPGSMSGQNRRPGD